MERLGDPKGEIIDIEKRIEKIQDYTRLLGSCKLRLHTQKSIGNIGRIANLQRAESRLRNRIKNLGKKLIIEHLR